MTSFTKDELKKLSPQAALKRLEDGNHRFINNLKINRNLLQQVNETTEGQNPFAVIISCMDSRTSAELIFDQGLGDIFSIRIAGNVINEDILGSTEYGTKVVGSKIVLVLGHTGCGAIGGAVNNVELGNLHFVTSKIQRCIPSVKKNHQSATTDEFLSLVSKENVKYSIQDLREKSPVLAELEKNGEIMIKGGMYDISTGVVEFYD